MNSATMGTALIGGYVLGRKKKAKVALGLALAMAAKRARASDLAGSFSPVFGNLNQRVRTELAGAGKAAAGSVLSAQADHLADALHKRTLDLQEKTGEEEPPEDEDRDEAAHEEDESDEDEYDEDENAEGENGEGENGDEETGDEEATREDAKKTSRRSSSQAEPAGETRRKTSGPGRRTRRSDDG